MDKLTNKVKCIFILSDKSSGSSMLWRMLTGSLNIKRYPNTQHYENETLFWTKAASLLELPQAKMIKSAVPYSKEKSRRDIEQFLQTNLNKDFTQYSDRDLVFKGWFELICEFGPVFIEKSPHHLLQISALNLMQQFAQIYNESVEVKYIGIIRNPYTTVCSQVRRWQPKLVEVMEQWKRIYINLQELVGKLGTEQVYLVRYEQLLTNNQKQLAEIFKFMNVLEYESSEVKKSVKKSKSDKGLSKFGFDLDDSSKYLAQSYGYELAELEPKKSSFWPAYKFYLYYIRGLAVYIKNGLVRLKK